MLGPKLKGLISGSAPLNMETQHYFAMLGIPVLQVYALLRRPEFAPWTTAPGCAGRVALGRRTRNELERMTDHRARPMFHDIEPSAETAKVLRDAGFILGPGEWMR